MEKKLPKNWINVKLNDLGTIQSGGTPKRSNSNYWTGDIPWVKISDLKKWYVEETTELITEEGLNNSSTKIFPKGTILFTIFATIGKVGVLSIDACTNQAIAGITPVNEIEHKFLTYALIELSEVLKNEGKGVAQKNINLTILKDLNIPLPPLKEQQRIVAKLDTLFTHLENLKTRLENIPTLLKHFRQAILTQAVTGELTQEWRVGKDLVNEYISIKSDEFREVNNILPQEWVALAFSSVANIKSNLVNPDSYLDLPYITPDCIEKESGQLIKEQLVEDIKPVSDKHFFEARSIIYSKIRPYLSKLIIANYEGLCSADMYPIKTELKLEYLFYYMLSSQFLCYANTAGTRSVLPKINQKGLSKIPVLVPPKKEQTEIVKRVENLFAKADAIEAQYTKLKEKIDSLPQAILAKAFKGELVPQLPTDGDAKDLLAEIQKLKEVALSRKPSLRGTKQSVKRKRKVKN